MSESSSQSPLAISAAFLFLSACKPGTTQTPADGARQGEGAPVLAAKIKCFGVNECAGQGACDVPDSRVAPGSKGHACAGQNECRGKGWLALPADECEPKGGEPV